MKPFEIHCGIASLGNDDPKFATSGIFYPPKSNSLDKLKFYARRFSSIEVDVSSYQMLQKKSYLDWAKETPPGFQFHFKAFGLFCGMSVALNALPWQVKPLLTDRQRLLDSLSWADLEGESNRDQVLGTCWQVFNETLLPFFERGKLGLVIFQFQANFEAGPSSRLHLEQCRARLDPRFKMAVEFRSHSWFQSDSGTQDTLAYLRSRSLVLVGFDELCPAGKLGVTVSDGVRTEGTPPGTQNRWAVCARTHPDVLLVRVHRRTGAERLLNDAELAEWHRLVCVSLRATAATQFSPSPSKQAIEASLQNAAPPVAAAADAPSKIAANAEPEPDPDAHRLCMETVLAGAPKVYVIFNTNWSDQAIANARNFEELVARNSQSRNSQPAPAAAAAAANRASPLLVANPWKEEALEAEKKSRKSILSFFSPSPAKKKLKK